VRRARAAGAARCALATLATLATLAFALPAAAQVAPRTLFLVARIGMPDANFRETVVLVAQDSNAQAVGVIINRPTTRSLASILPGERFRRYTEPVYFGGPVGANGFFALFRAEKSPGDAIAMLPGLHFALDPATVDELMAHPPARIRFYSGYAGWGPGQLQGEIERGDWAVLEADADTAFRRDTGNLWQDLMRRAQELRAQRREIGLPVVPALSRLAGSVLPPGRAASESRQAALRKQ
jgi:putative transcriptional regulator